MSPDARRGSATLGSATAAETADTRRDTLLRAQTMRRLLIDGLLKPGAAILFLLGFGLPLVFFGFQSVKIQGERTAHASARITLTRAHLLGLVATSRTVDDVDAVTETTVELTRPAGPRGFIHVSNVALLSGDTATPIFLGSSNASEGPKRRVAQELDAFLKNPQIGSYRGQFAIHSAFGWLGLPFLVLGVYGLLRWPWLLSAAWRKGPQGGSGTQKRRRKR